MPALRTDLAGWLRHLDEKPVWLLGSTGHVLLSAPEEANAIAHLRQHVLPALLRDCRPARVAIASGLAPGADLLVKDVASQWFAEAGIPCQLVALLPAPVDVVIGDWVLMAHDRERPPSADAIARTCARIAEREASCDVIVDLLPAGYDHRALVHETARREQYRRLAACLAEQSDTLVAVLRAQNLMQPGGTAEVVEWRRSPGQIPPQFSTTALRPRSGRRALMVIDPGIAPTGPSEARHG